MAFINRWHCFLFVFVALALPVSADDAGQCLGYLLKGDFQSAYPVCKRAAEQGDAKAQYSLGVMYYNGDGVVQDKAEAARWYRQAAEQGVAEAQYNLGFMYYKGDGVVEDKVAAERWYRQAAEQGDALAQYNLGIMYYNGDGVVEDKVAAERWYRQAAEQGNAEAQSSLGGMYYNGDGVDKDRVAAEKWYRQAAWQGDALAQSILGLMYYSKDEGIVEDPQEAYIWLLLAAGNGVEEAGQAKEVIEQELTASERRTAIEEAARRQQKISGN